MLGDEHNWKTIFWCSPGCRGFHPSVASQFYGLGESLRLTTILGYFWAWSIELFWIAQGRCHPKIGTWTGDIGPCLEIGYPLQSIIIIFPITLPGAGKGNADDFQQTCRAANIGMSPARQWLVGLSPTLETIWGSENSRNGYVYNEKFTIMVDFLFENNNPLSKPSYTNGTCRFPRACT